MACEAPRRAEPVLVSGCCYPPSLSMSACLSTPLIICTEKEEDAFKRIVSWLKKILPSGDNSDQLLVSRAVTRRKVFHEGGRRSVSLRDLPLRTSITIMLWSTARFSSSNIGASSNWLATLVVPGLRSIPKVQSSSSTSSCNQELFP